MSIRIEAPERTRSVMISLGRKNRGNAVVSDVNCPPNCEGGRIKDNCPINFLRKNQIVGNVKPSALRSGYCMGEVS